VPLAAHGIERALPKAPTSATTPGTPNTEATPHMLGAPALNADAGFE
jgi:hypothetical protein